MLRVSQADADARVESARCVWRGDGLAAQDDDGGVADALGLGWEVSRQVLRHLGNVARDVALPVRWYPAVAPCVYLNRY